EPASRYSGAEHRPRGGFFGAWAHARGVDGQVPRTGSLRTASGPGGSSAKEFLSGAAAPPDPSRRRERRPGNRFEGGSRGRALGSAAVSQSERAQLFRRLHHEPSPLVLANAWDVASARIVARAGAR